MSVRDRFEQLNRLTMKQLMVLSLLVPYYSTADLLALIDEILQELE